MRKLLLILSVLCLAATTFVSAKENEDLLKANYLYRKLAFFEAIPYYEKVAATVNDPEMFAHLGDCYRMIKEPEKAAVWYSKSLALGGASPETKLSYGEVLMTLQQYEDAAKWLREYQQSNPRDRRVANLITSCQQAGPRMMQMPVGIATFMAFNSDGNEFGPSIRKNQLVFTSDTNLISGFRLFKGKRQDAWSGNPFYNIYAVDCEQDGRCGNELKRIGKVNTSYHDGPATFTSDGNTMYFTRTNIRERFISRSPLPDEGGTVHLQIMTASGYNPAEGSFDKISEFPFNNKEYSTAHPAISPSGKTIVFSSDMPGGEGSSDLYISKKDAAGHWSEPRNLGAAINTEGKEMFPYLQDDETLYFASDGWVGYGGLDIYESAWDESIGSFGLPENVGSPVNSSYDDMGLVLTSQNTQVGYFASSRPAAKKGDNIYGINFQTSFVKLTVLDAFSDKPVAGASVVLKNSLKDNRSLSTDAEGNVITQIFPQVNYTATASKAGYKDATVKFSSLQISGDTIPQIIKLESNLNLSYDGIVIDEATMEPLDDVYVTFTKLGEKPDTVFVPDGIVTKELKPNSEYRIYALKAKYYGNEKIVSTVGIGPNAGPMALEDTIFMKELKVGQVFKIENIYYDYDKATIRKDALPSLNTLVDLLNQYPDMTIQLNSHTDCRGSNKYNQNLSRERANSVVKYLKERGISSKRLTYKGYGETMPVEKCATCESCSEEQHQRNRRTEFQIISM